jgi:hypothetical protein
VSRVRYRAAAGWEDGLREQALPDMVKRAEIVASNVNRIQEGRFMAQKKTWPVVVRVRHGQALVYNTKHGWHLQEFGSVNNVVQAPLRRGVIAAGLRFSPAPPPGV